MYYEELKLDANNPDLVDFGDCMVASLEPTCELRYAGDPPVLQQRWVASYTEMMNGREVEHYAWQWRNIEAVKDDPLSSGMRFGD